MVDTVQNLVGTTSSVVVPESSSAPQVSTSGSGAAVEVGPSAPVSSVAESSLAPVSLTASISVEVSPMFS